MYNPNRFKKDELIKDVHTEKVYKVIEPDKKGMAKLQNLESGIVENWNACNNYRFIKQPSQFSLF